MIPPSMQNSTTFPSTDPVDPLQGFSGIEAVRDLSPEESEKERQHAEEFARHDDVEASDPVRDPSKTTPFYDPSYTVSVHARRLVLLETLLTEHLEYVRMERELIEAEMRGAVRKQNT